MHSVRASVSGQGKSGENDKCANCKRAHPAWSKSCAVFLAASKNSPKASLAQVVASASVGKADLEAEVQKAMASIWDAMAKVVSVVVSRAVLDLDVETKKPKMDRGGLVRKIVANTVRTINECGLLQPSKPLEVAGVQQNVWKEIFPQNTFQQPSQASSAPINNDNASEK